MVFIDKNGQPKIIYHNCDVSRKGLPISKAELHEFGIGLLSELYKNEGMTIIDIIAGYEYPQFVMESRNKKKYYVAVQATIFPNNPLGLSTNDCFEIKQLAIKYNATAVFAG